MTFASACASDAKNGFYDTKWMCSRVTSAFVSNAKNGCGTYSLHFRLRFHPLNAEGDVDADADACRRKRKCHV